MVSCRSQKTKNVARMLVTDTHQPWPTARVSVFVPCTTFWGINGMYCLTLWVEMIRNTFFNRLLRFNLQQLEQRKTVMGASIWSSRVQWRWAHGSDLHCMQHFTLLVERLAENNETGIAISATEWWWTKHWLPVRGLPLQGPYKILWLGFGSSIGVVHGLGVSVLSMDYPNGLSKFTTL